MSTRTFQRRIENFICERCSGEVVGNGYTNHCPHCLWSKHVDINPGDRACPCLGAMRPERIELKSQQSWIHHVCETCGYEGRVKSALGDDYEQVLAVARGGVVKP